MDPGSTPGISTNSDENQYVIKIVPEKGPKSLIWGLFNINSLNFLFMDKTYLGDSHRKYSIVCQKEVEEMLQHPLTQEQFQAQIRRNALGSELQGQSQGQDD